MYNLYFYYYNLGVPDVNFYFQKNHFLDVFLNTSSLFKSLEYGHIIDYLYLPYFFDRESPVQIQ